MSLSAGGVAASKGAKWQSSGWSALPGPNADGANRPPFTMQVFDSAGTSTLFLGGEFFRAGDLPTRYGAFWNGTGWSTIAEPGGVGLLIGRVSCFAGFDNGSGSQLYVGGDFQSAGWLPASYIARWDRTRWFGLQGTGSINSVVNSLCVHDDDTGPALYAGGPFTSVGATLVNHVAKWDDASWSPLNGNAIPGVDGTVSVQSGLSVNGIHLKRCEQACVADKLRKAEPSASTRC